MGIFGGGSTTYHNTSTMPIYDENVAGMLKQTVLSATATNRGIGSSLLENILNSNVGNLGRLHRYGQSGKYKWGLPEQVERHLPPKTIENIKLVIESEVGEPVILTYYSFDNFLNPNTAVGYEWTIPNTPNLPPSPSIPSSGQADNNGYDWYYVVEYTTVAEPEVFIKWWFKESDATDEYRSFLQMEKLTSQPYYPIIPYRVDGERWDNKPAYQQHIYQASKYLGINSTTMGNSIQEMSDANEADGNPNPMEEAYIFLGVPLNTKVQVGKEYLYKFFKEMYKTSSVTEGDYLQWENTPVSQDGNAVPPRNSITVKDLNFENTFSWSYIKRYTVQGRVKDVDGKYFKNKGYVVQYEEKPRVTLSDGSYLSGSSYKCIQQNNANTYTVMEVVGIGFSSLCVGKEMYYTVDEAMAPETDSEDEEKVVIPLHKVVMTRMGAIRGHDLMNVAIRMQINDKVRIKHKRNWFAIITFVIAVVVTVLFPPAGGWTLSAVMSTIGINLAVALVLKVLSPAITKVLQDVFGEELGAMLAVIVMFVAMQGMTSLLTPVPASSAATVVPTAATPTASFSINLTTLQYVNLAFDVANAYIAADFKKEQEGYEDTLKGIADESAELDEMLDILSVDNISSLVVATQLQDTNDILETNLYVSKEMRKVSNLKLITETTQEYTNAMRDTGIVYSPINSARILA